MSTAAPIVEKKRRGRKKGYKVLKKPQDVAAVCDVRPAPFEDPSPDPRRETTGLAIDEHNPVMQVMATEWERLEAVIQDARSKQAYLEELVEKAKAS